MSTISIKTVKSKTFFSGSINLSGQKEESLDILESDGFNITIPEHASQVNIELVQQILSTRVFYKVGDTVLTDRIMISKDIDPSYFLETIGLSLENYWE